MRRESIQKKKNEVKRDILKSCSDLKVKSIFYRLEPLIPQYIVT